MYMHSYLFKSKPAALSEPFTGGNACSLILVNFRTHFISVGIFTDINFFKIDHLNRIIICKLIEDKNN